MAISTLAIGNLCAQNSLSGNWKMDVPDGQGGMLTIKVSLTTDSYTIDIGMDGSADSYGKYEVKDGQITIWDTGGSNACPSDLKGVYKLTVTETEFKMDRVSDPCEGRGNPNGPMVWKKI